MSYHTGINMRGGETRPNTKGWGMNKFSINIIAEDGKAKVDFSFNGEPVKGLFAVNFLANTRSGEFNLTGIRFKTDEKGNFFVDPKTNDTAMEGIDLLTLLENGISMKERIDRISKELDFELQNIKDTSTLRARNMIKERLSC